jgi:SSS family solute:Na+ symporter
VNSDQVALGVFVAVLGLVVLLGLVAARWRRPISYYNLDEWGLGGRSFGPVLTWFLLGGDIYTAYTLVALPALMWGVGAAGFFAVPYTIIVYPIVFVAAVRLWSVAHAHGLVTPADFTRARFGSPLLALLVAITGIAATIPYIALQLVGLEATLKVLGLDGTWPLWTAFAAIAIFTYRAGLRGPALLSILKDVLILWAVLAALVIVATLPGGWGLILQHADSAFAATPSQADGVLLSPINQVNYATLALGSALALFLYPHTVTGVLAAKNRLTIRSSLAALPIYTFVLAVISLLGYLAIAKNITPMGADPATGTGGDRNTIMPTLFHDIFPDWCAGLAYAALAVGALVPAAIMSIGAANLFTRNIYKQFLRPSASPAEETAVSRTVSLFAKLGAVLVVIMLNPQFSIDLQLLGGVLILQTLPAVGIGLFTPWPHRYALVAGLVIGLAVGIIALYSIPQLAADGSVVRPHFGGSALPLRYLGFDTAQRLYAGILALAANLAVAVLGTAALRLLHVPDGRDQTRRKDYDADEGDPNIQRLDELLDGNLPPMQQAQSNYTRDTVMGNPADVRTSSTGTTYRSPGGHHRRPPT